MPIFEFQCRECGEKVERIQRIPAEGIDCPACGNPAKRIVSVTSATATDSGCSAPAGSRFG